MKNRVLRIWLLGSAGALLVAPWSLTAQPASVPPTPTSTENSPVRLPYGVEDVLKLTRAQISEDITLNYIQNSGTIYNLGPQDIVYLRNQGVSDRVINAMLDQRQKAAAATTAPAAPAASTTTMAAATVPNAPTVPDAPTVPPAPTYTQPAPTYIQPPVAEIQPAPSTVYVIPYPPASYAYYGYYSRPYGYYPFYGGYYYGGPAVSLGFRFGGGYGHYGHYGHYGYSGHYGHSGHWHR